MAYVANRYDSALFTAGVWSEYEGGRFKIALKGNVNYRQALLDVVKKYRRRYGDEMTPGQQDEMHAEAMAIGLLTDWENVKAYDQDGKSVELPYSVENATALLLADPSLVDFIVSQSRIYQRFERKRVDGEA